MAQESKNDSKKNSDDIYVSSKKEEDDTLYFTLKGVNVSMRVHVIMKMTNIIILNCINSFVRMVGLIISL